MALCWSVQGTTHSLFFGLWVLVFAVCEVGSFSSKDFPPGLKTISRVLTINNIEHYIDKRSTEDQTFKPRTSIFNTDIDSSNHSKSALPSEKNEEEDESKERNISYGVNKDEVKLKHKQQKFYVKNYNSSKIALNESNGERKKSNLFVSQESKNNNFKKELKLSPNNNDPILKSNLDSAVPGSYKLEKIKISPTKDLGNITFSTTVKPVDIKMNETHVMSDQPVPIDTSNNATDLSNHDSLDLFSDNTTSNSFDDSNSTTSADSRIMPTTEGWNVLVVSGIVLGTLVFIGVVASGGYVIYRRRIWNKPQTLSDKCSNADSSGYIDDSTIRENSEEMYSLDNDSFLNSLEAMTIQNYWTDSVKHTKL